MLSRTEFFNMCVPQEQRHPSSQRMDFSALALHISLSAQDIKILNAT